MKFNHFLHLGQPSKQHKNNSSDESEEHTLLFTEHTVNNVKASRKQLSVTLPLSKRKVPDITTPRECLIDTGSTCNQISVDSVIDVDRNAVILKCNTKLNPYDISYMRPLGTVILHTVY